MVTQGYWNRSAQQLDPGEENVPTAPARTWTRDLSIMSPLLYHWATPTPQSMAPWGQCCVCASLHGGQNCRIWSGVCGPVWHGPRKLSATYDNDISADHESHMLGDVGHKVNKCRAVFWVSSQHQHLGPAKCHRMSQHFDGATGAKGCVLTLQVSWRWVSFYSLTFCNNPWWVSMASSVAS